MRVILGATIILLSIPSLIGPAPSVGTRAAPTSDLRIVAETPLCQADLSLPVSLELEAEGSRAVCRISSTRTTERFDLEFVPSPSVVLESSAPESFIGMGPGEVREFELRAHLRPGGRLGTVQVLATAWIDGRPFLRGASWNLASTREPNRHVDRIDRLPVGEVRAQRVVGG